MYTHDIVGGDKEETADLFDLTDSSIAHLSSWTEIDGGKAAVILNKKYNQLRQDVEQYEKACEEYLDYLENRKTNRDSYAIERISLWLEERGDRYNLFVGKLSYALQELNKLKKEQLELQEKYNSAPFNKRKDSLDLILKNEEKISNIFKDEYLKSTTDLNHNLDEILLDLKQKVDIYKNELSLLETNEGKIKIICRQIDILNKYSAFIEKNFKKEVVFLETNEQKSDFKKLLEENKKKDESFAYVVNGKVGDNSHWFYLIQEKNNIYIFDSSGNARKKDFREKVLEDVYGNFDIKENVSNLQTNSGCCQTYAIDGIDLLRFEIFNVLSGRAVSGIVGYDGRLDEIFEIYFNEKSFSKKNNREKSLDGRIETLEKAINSLKIKEMSAAYSLKEDFNSKMEKYLTMSVDFLKTLKNENIEFSSLFYKDNTFKFRASPIFLEALEQSGCEFDRETSRYKKKREL